MSKILSAMFAKAGAIGLVGATVFACGHVQTASQERAQIDESARQTAQSARETGQSAGGAASNFGTGVVQGAEATGEATRLGAHEVGQTLTGKQGNPSSEARSEEYRQQMQEHGERAGRSMESAGHETGAAARGAGSTVYNAGRTTVNTGEHGVGAVRRAAGEKPAAAEGQGNSACPPTR